MKTHTTKKVILAQSTVQISWQILYSGILRVAKVSDETKSGFSLEALPNIILGCTALEAFCNEMSSVVSSLLFEYLSDPYSPFVIGLERFEDKVGVSEQACRKLSEIKTNASGNIKDRYKKLCSILSIELPENYQELSKLFQVRNGVVHFRACDRNVVDKKGVITYDHDLPDFYKQLIGIKYRGYDLTFVEDIKQKVAEPGEIDWVNRISTPTVALWSMEVVLLAILHVIENIPVGDLKQRVVNSYRPRIDEHQTLFNWGLSLIDEGVRNTL